MSLYQKRHAREESSLSYQLQHLVLFAVHPSFIIVIIIIIVVVIIFSIIIFFLLVLLSFFLSPHPLFFLFLFVFVLSFC